MMTLRFNQRYSLNTCSVFHCKEDVGFKTMAYYLQEQPFAYIISS